MNGRLNNQRVYLAGAMDRVLDRGNGWRDDITPFDLMKTIRSVDLRLVDISDFLIVNLDLDHYACGTWEELFLANRSKKPIVIHIEQGKQNTPDWLFGTIPHQMIFSTWLELQSYLQYIDGDSQIEHHNRWRFFDL